MSSNFYFGLPRTSDGTNVSKPTDRKFTNKATRSELLHQMVLPSAPNQKAVQLLLIVADLELITDSRENTSSYHSSQCWCWRLYRHWNKHIHKILDVSAVIIVLKSGIAVDM